MRACLTILLLLSAYSISWAQLTEVRFYTSKDIETTRDSAKYFTIFNWKSEDKTACTIKDYLLKDSTLTYEAEYSNFDSSAHVGSSKVYNQETGKLFKEYLYNHSGFKTTFKQYYPNGNIKRIDNYEKGKKTIGILKSPEGVILPYEEFEVMPEFAGGQDELMKYLAATIKYPKKSRRKGITGEVQIQFAVCTDGALCDFEVSQSVNEEMDQEVIRVLKEMPKWTPGKQDGKAVKVLYTLPVLFAPYEE